MNLCRQSVSSIITSIFLASPSTSLAFRPRALVAAPSSLCMGRPRIASIPTAYARVYRSLYFPIAMTSTRTLRRSARLATTLTASSSSSDGKGNSLRKDTKKGRKRKMSAKVENSTESSKPKGITRRKNIVKSSKTLLTKKAAIEVPVDNDPSVSASPIAKVYPKKTIPSKSLAKPSKKKTDTLGRPREDELKKTKPDLQWVMGIDEAGRGPLAGPVVAAAAIVPIEISGITDSKKITCEDERERLYEEIIQSPIVSWSVAVVDAQRIDEINILQATLTAMSMAASALVIHNDKARTDWEVAAQLPASTDRTGCYVTCGGTMPVKLATEKSDRGGSSKKKNAGEEASGQDHHSSSQYYALVDGNRVPLDLPCEGESIVKGDSKEYSIAAASILAKVTRDRLMHSYDELYPDYQLAKHKGYPTKDHMAAVSKFGASPIHRRTFAPLKHMLFDDNGKVIGVVDKKDSKKKS